MRTNLLRPILRVGLAVAVLTVAIAQQQQTPPQRPPAVIPGQAAPSTQTPRPAAAQQTPTQPPPGVIPGQAVPATQTAPPAAAPRLRNRLQRPLPRSLRRPPLPTSGNCPAQTPATTPAQPPRPPIAPPRGLDIVIPNGSLTDFIEIVAKRVGFNYIPIRRWVPRARYRYSPTARPSPLTC